jgi:hypothetical protein
MFSSAAGPLMTVEQFEKMVNVDVANLTAAERDLLSGLVVRIFCSTDYNGDGRFDILWRHDSGLPIFWELDGGAIIGYHTFGTVDPVWQIQ